MLSHAPEASLALLRSRSGKSSLKAARPEPPGAAKSYRHYLSREREGLSQASGVGRDLEGSPGPNRSNHHRSP